MRFCPSYSLSPFMTPQGAGLLQPGLQIRMEFSTAYIEISTRAGGSLVRIGRQGLGQTAAPGFLAEAGRCYLTADRYGIWPSLNTAFFSVSTTYTSPVLVTARPVGRTRVVVPAVFLLPSSLPFVSNL